MTAGSLVLNCVSVSLHSSEIYWSLTAHVRKVVALLDPRTRLCP